MVQELVFEILTSFLYVLLTIFALVFFSFSSSFFLFFPRQAKKMGNTFQGATAMSSCNKRRILRGWAGNADFNGIGDNNGFSANDACPAFSDVTFKEASWGMCLPDTPLSTCGGVFQCPARASHHGLVFSSTNNGVYCPRLTRFRLCRVCSFLPSSCLPSPPPFPAPLHRLGPGHGRGDDQVGRAWRLECERRR